jgi:hypothetical protein
VTDSGTFALLDDDLQSTGLFNASRRSLAISSEVLKSHRGRKLQEDPKANICMCPVGTQPGDNQGVTVAEFEDGLNLQIEELQRGGSLPPPDRTVASSYENWTATAGYDAVNNVIEVNPIDCGTSITEFKSVIYTGLRVDEPNLGSTDLIEIEQGFKALYNVRTLRSINAGQFG